MKPLFPDGSIVVPSKCRAGKIFTEKFYPETILVVEPQEAISYKKLHPKVVVLPENDRGLVFSRQFILDNASGRILVLDDDINSIVGCDGVSKNGFIRWLASKGDPKEVKRLTLALLKNFAMAAPNKRAAATLGSCQKRLSTFIGINVDKLKTRNVRYDFGCKQFQDFDIQLSVLRAGFHVAFFQDFAWDAPLMMENKGGCQADKNRTPATMKDSLNHLIKKHPKSVELVIKKRGLEPKMNWKKYQKQIHIFKPGALYGL